MKEQIFTLSILGYELRAIDIRTGLKRDLIFNMDDVHSRIDAGLIFDVDMRSGEGEGGRVTRFSDFVTRSGRICIESGDKID